ncbi:hypothetical protein DM02DRAFT_625810 [Periconia macrospinosa]|uniref:RBR-type E3 ubiquitin transferase n=1 Tax=Periconia macrospinosa TaxID=97972 RepID=A0A2V1DZI5_9PLEO|nr:hypothetical protein DM02DRAFT_625810 [Periconia macrospinosa]
MVGMLRRLSSKVSRVFKKSDNDDTSTTISLDPLLVIDEEEENDSLYSGPPRSSYIDPLPQKRDVSQQPVRRETWRPGVTPAIISRPSSENGTRCNENAASDHISRGGFGGSRYPGSIRRRPVPSPAARSTASPTRDEPQIASDAQIACAMANILTTSSAVELQLRSWKREEETYGEEMGSSHGIMSSNPRPQVGRDRDEYPASSDSSATTVPGEWQEYDQERWDSASSLVSSSTSPSPPAPLENIPVIYGENNFWAEWMGSSSSTANPNTLQYQIGARKPVNDTNFPNSTEEPPTDRQPNPFGRREFLSQPRECVVCLDSKSPGRFPAQALTSDCDHPPGTCLDCLETHISTTLNNQTFTPDMVKCPECLSPLSVYAVQQYATPAIAELFMARANDNHIDQIPNLFRCPAPNCGSAQIHDHPEGDGNESPIVRCVKCSGKFCFRHSVVWHETLTCEEYDEFLINPHGFRSAFERENERVEREREIQEHRRREQEEKDAEYAQSLMEDEQREEAKRKAAAEKKARREREERARKKKEEELRLQRDRRRKMEEEAERKRKQEAANLKTIDETTKRCPNQSCGWPIEKNAGCAHMTFLLRLSGIV